MTVCKLGFCFALCWQYLLDNNMNEMEYFADPKWGVDPEALNRLKLVASSTFERCSYTKAIQILKDALAKVSLPGHHYHCCCNLLLAALS
eukprot:COSAG02_NODE_3188_length_7205_cov_25.313538_5_plen_90_part_00